MCFPGIACWQISRPVPYSFDIKKINRVYMKNNLSFTWVVSLIFALTVFTGCEEDTKDFEDLGVTAVKTLLDPADNGRADLQSAGNFLFKWEKAEAGDGSSLVYYDVLFDKADGDFSAPLFYQASDNKSLATAATLTPAVLDNIAELAGASPGQEVTLKWTVRSNRGIMTALAEQSRTLTLVRKISVAK